MKITYGSAKTMWEGNFGYSIRTLLDLDNSAGSFLWFFYTLQDKGHDLPDRFTVGQAVKAMLKYKLQDYRNTRNL